LRILAIAGNLSTLSSDAWFWHGHSAAEKS
jgi:hypothetical protein